MHVLTSSEFADSALLNGSEDFAPSNPFVSKQEKESYFESALQILQVVTSQRNQKFYNVTNSRGHVVKLCLFKQAYKLGEDVVGSLDFSESSVPCIQYAVSLQSWEELTPECRKEKQKPCVTQNSKFHEMVIGFNQTNFILPIPLNCTPSFHTDLINLKWKLHFEFVTATSELNMSSTELPNPSSMDGRFWQGPNSVNVETMTWDLQVKLYPNLPSYISKGLKMELGYSQTLYPICCS